MGPISCPINVYPSSHPITSLLSCQDDDNDDNDILSYNLIIVWHFVLDIDVIIFST